MLRQAFKEWAVICEALATGKQAIILRKGGIAEEAGEFVLEHRRFWLFPTFVHQQQTGVKAEAEKLLDKVMNDKPLEGQIRLTHWAEVTGVHDIHDETAALLLDRLHLWSLEAVRKRFAYRTPGLYVLAVRVFRSADTHTISDTLNYQGCKSWVELDGPLSTGGSAPVLSDTDYDGVRTALDTLLTPTAIV